MSRKQKLNAAGKPKLTKKEKALGILEEGMTVGEVIRLLSMFPPDASFCVETDNGPFCPKSGIVSDGCR
jgi:hypothetical protein